MDVNYEKTNKIKCKRGPDWEREEKAIFFHCYQKSCKILEGTKKDFNANYKNKLSADAWVSLMNNFNVHCNV